MNNAILTVKIFGFISYLVRFFSFRNETVSDMLIYSVSYHCVKYHQNLQSTFRVVHIEGNIQKQINIPNEIRYNLHLTVLVLVTKTFVGLPCCP